MLLNLSVENFILIHELEMDFRDGFTCITGETGAGKSILVGALGLILGQRADIQVLMDKQKKCIIEGTFSLEGYGMEDLFASMDLDYDKQTILRREITPQGKSRAFVNDTPVNLSQLKEIGERLVDIHSQNQTLELNGAVFQMAMLDSYSGTMDDLRQYEDCFRQYQSLKQELEHCIQTDAKASADREYYEFQLDELKKAALSEDEPEVLESELEMLTHAEEIRLRIYQAIELLEDSEHNILQSLKEARQGIEQVSRFTAKLEPIAGRMESCAIELKEVVHDLREQAEHIQYEPERIQFLNQRLDLVNHLLQKHKVASAVHLLELMQYFEQRLADIDSLEGRIQELKGMISVKEKELTMLAQQLTEKRSGAIPGITREMEDTLKDLGMPSARFQVKLIPLDDFSRSGKEKVSFLFAANKGGELREIRAVASGGELSRLMLAVKSLVVKRSMLPTILFDEIDSGVSGEIAGKIGSILRRMAGTMQVIAITHLPQIAGKSQHHLLAYKEDQERNTISSLRILDEQERVNEIARMLSNETITESARAAARELMLN